MKITLAHSQPAIVVGPFKEPLEYYATVEAIQSSIITHTIKICVLLFEKLYNKLQLVFTHKIKSHQNCVQSEFAALDGHMGKSLDVGSFESAAQ